MPRTQAFIPVAKGLDQKLDERLRDADSLQVVTNAYYRRNNALTKRHGFRRMTTTMQNTTATSLASEGTPKGIFSTGSELCVRGYRELFSYQPATSLLSDRWWGRGELSPFTGAQRTLFSDQRGVGTCDTASTKGFTIHAEALWKTRTTATDYVASFCASIETSDGTIIQNKVSLVGDTNTTDQNWDCTGARCVAAENGNQPPSLWCGVQRAYPPASVNYGTLQWYRWQSTALTTAPALTRTHADLWYPDFNRHQRRYDACESRLGLWAYAYIKVAPSGTGAPMRTIQLYAMNDNVQVATVNIPVPALWDHWKYVSISYGATSNQLYIAAVAENAAGTQEALYISTRDPNTLAVVVAPVQIATTNAANNEFFGAVGVVEGALSGLTLVAITATRYQNSTLSNGNAAAYCYFLNSALTVNYGTSYTYNARWQSKPWFRSDRFYGALRSVFQPNTLLAPMPAQRDGYGAECIVDIGVPLFSNGRPRLVGRYDMGAVPAHQIFFENYGSLQHVTIDGTVARYATTRMVASDFDVQLALLGADEIKLDYAGVSTQQATTRGTATIGGGNVSWYAANSTEELGWSTAPFIIRITDVSTPGGTLPHTATYQYLAVFEAYDEKGTLIRSLPGPPISCTVTNPHNSVEVNIYSLGPTQRYGKRRFGYRLYRAGSDGVFRSCTEASRDTLDSETSPIFPTIVDKGSAYDVLYTQGGAELEAAGPDGAAYVTTTSKRVWLAGFYKRDRVMYSKLYDPTTANEYALAPEFNDAFAFLLPGGENVTGLCEMDDKVIVFTSSNIYAIAGNGPDDGGRGNDFSGLQLVSSDTGCVDARSVVSTPIGVFFQAPSGIFVLGRDLQLTFVGAAVRDITDVWSEITSAVLVPEHNHVRFTCRAGGEASTVLVYDFDQLAWLEWQLRKMVGPNSQLLNIVGACLHNGIYYVLDAAGLVFYEDETRYRDDQDDVYVSMSIQTGWLQAAQQSGWQRIRKIAALCKSLDPHALRIRVAQDFGAFSQSFTWTYAQIQAMKLNELVEMYVQTQKCTSFQISIDDFVDGSSPPVTGQGYECAGFAVELSGKRGLYKPGTQQRN